MTRCNSSTFAFARPKVPSYSTLEDHPFHNICFETYPLLGQLTRTLVLAVSEEFDNTTLVWCKSIPSLAIASINWPSAEVTYPETSLTISLTNAVFLLKWPLVRLILGLTTRASVFYISHKIISPLSPSSDLQK
jgi:hypothetical protein